MSPATSRSFEVVDTAEGCDFLVGSGPRAPALAARHGLPLVWDGCDPLGDDSVWCASALGLAFALAARESDPRVVAVAHPDVDASSAERSVRFPDPVGRLAVEDTSVAGKPIALARSSNEFSACLVEGAARRVTVVDHAAFLSGVALAAGVEVATRGGGPVWSSALPYLETGIAMGLVMAEGS